VLRGELLLLLLALLALHREEVEKEQASVVLVVQLANEYQTALNDLGEQGTELRAAKDNKRHCKGLEEEVVQSEVGTRRLQPDHDPRNHSNNQELFRARVQEPDPLNHKLVLLFRAHPVKPQYQKPAALAPVQPDLHFLMLLNAGRLCQHIGKVSPHSGFEDSKKTPTRSTEIHFRNSFLDKSLICQLLAPIFSMLW
jgi:hypothetical protein